jgi:hypothetical protein
MRLDAAPTPTISTAVLPQSSLKQGLTTPTTTAPSPKEGLVKLTKEIQQLEKKVMERPSRRSLDSDDDIESASRQSGSITWNRRMDNSKKYDSILLLF